MKVTTELARFQAFLDPVSGSLATPPIIGNQLKELVKSKN